MKLKANPFAQAPRPVQIIVEAGSAVLDALEPVVEEWSLAITRYIDAVVPHLVLLVDEAQRELVEGIITQAAPEAKLRVTKLDEIDWVAQVQKDFPPFRMGPFYVYGSHAREALPRNHFPLLIDAASAFGTGEHATTAGCLVALAAEKKHRRHAQRVADVGCGTAILAIAAARVWKSARIIACDNDPVAVEVSRHNLRVNNIASRAKAFVSDGYKALPMRRAGKQEVIVANILARPLMKMAKDAARQLAPGGTLILSGLLRTQEARVLSAHRMQGLYLKKHIRRGQWSVLVLK